VALAAIGAWYGLSPAVPEVRLKPGSDPELVQEVARDRGAIRRSPWSDAARARLAMLLHVHRLEADAAVYYAQAEGLNPAEPRWPYLHAFVVADDPPAAVELLRRAARLVEGGAGNPDAPLLKLADVCLEQELLEEAEMNYRKLLARWPEHARAQLGMARVAVLRGLPEEARGYLRSCLEAPTTRKAAHTLLAEVCQRQGKAEEAARASRQAEEWPRDRAWPDPWLDRARERLTGRAGRLYRLTELREQGRVVEAAMLSRQMQKDYPDVYWAEIARTRCNEGKWNPAEDAAREAVRLNPDFADGHFFLAAALLGKKHFAEAEEGFRRVIEWQPANGLAYREWARCAAGRGDRAEAMRRLRQALRYMPQDPEANRELGELLAEEGDRDEALRLLRQAVRLDPANARARQRLGEAERGTAGGRP
jgi:tetratricopeptide (TPR) repeat protein